MVFYIKEIEFVNKYNNEKTTSEFPLNTQGKNELLANLENEQAFFNVYLCIDDEPCVLHSVCNETDIFKAVINGILSKQNPNCGINDYNDKAVIANLIMKNGYLLECSAWANVNSPADYWEKFSDYKITQIELVNTQTNEKVMKKFPLDEQDFPEFRANLGDENAFLNVYLSIDDVPYILQSDSSESNGFYAIKNGVLSKCETNGKERTWFDLSKFDLYRKTDTDTTIIANMVRCNSHWEQVPTRAYTIEC